MDDLISRKSAIEVTAKWLFDVFGIKESDSTAPSIIKSLKELPSAQPETHEKRTETHACDCISRKAAIDAIEQMQIPIMRSAIEYEQFIFKGMSEALNAVNDLPSAQPEMLACGEGVLNAQPEHTNSCYTNSWCIDCKEYDKEKHSCPRFNRVIKQTLDDAYRHGETEAEARFHAQQRWIPCSERLPEERQEILATTTDNAWGDVVIIRTYYKEMHKSVIAWMPLPEPYAERRTDEADYRKE